MNNHTIFEDIDKSSWGNGPWQTEPDRVEFKHAGLPCLMVRNHRLGHWCGYAAVPPNHPLHGKGSLDQDERVGALEVHGGITYASLCHGRICHVPDPGEPDNVWWFGFDCGHAFDLSPGIEPMLKECHRPADQPLDAATLFGGCEYRDLAYVRHEVEQLAEQLAEAR